MNGKHNVPEKPKNWPANNRECLIENLARAMEAFKKDPSLQAREFIVSLTNTYELNQKNAIGEFRVTEYEVMQINTLYLNASHYQFSSVKSLLYELIAETTQIHKIVYKMSMSNMGIPAGVVTESIDAYRSMIRPLAIFHAAYRDYTWDKSDTLCQCIIRLVENVAKDRVFSPFELTKHFVNMLHDFGNMRGTKREELIRFTRDELIELFRLEAKLLKDSGQNPITRPLKGMMMIQLSSLILKSRNGYHDGLVYKCIQKDAAISSVRNGQVWMKRIEKLNDDRECHVVPELLKDARWLKMPWLEGLDLKPTRVYYVSSFSKVQPDARMRREYGACVYGFKGDKLTELIGPLEKRHWVKRDLKTGEELDAHDDYALAQVVPTDVLYGREAAKSELSYVCRVVDLMPMTSDEKRRFFEELIQYWILSVKDIEWSNEQERRYVLFTYTDTEYPGTETDETYLKVPTTMFKFPDVILGNNPVRAVISTNIDAKRRFVPGHDYFFCHECLLRDRDLAAAGETPSACPICGSKNVEVVR